MNIKIKNIITILIFSLFVFCLSALCLLKPSPAFSESERRELAKFPQISVQSIISGEFMEGFELYATERFPARDDFRAIKAHFSTKIFKKLDNNGLFVADGHISKIDNELNPKMLEHAAEKISFLYNSYIKDNNAKAYFAVVPDKNYLLCSKNGYPSLDYEDFIQKMREKTPFLQYIDISNLLRLDDYYKTDTHWKQDKIIDVAEKIASEMGSNVETDYIRNKLEYPFYGVYSGQLAMDFEPDEIVYLTNDTLKNGVVTYYDTGKPKIGEMYNMKKASGKDAYEMFLSGTTPLVTIENKVAKNDRELIIFRDSFGSSLAPLLVDGYKKITLVDIRYIQSRAVGHFVDFTDKDVLFIYSTTILNSSLSMK